MLRAGAAPRPTTHYALSLGWHGLVLKTSVENKQHTHVTELPVLPHLSGLAEKNSLWLICGANLQPTG